MPKTTTALLALFAISALTAHAAETAPATAANPANYSKADQDKIGEVYMKLKKGKAPTTAELDAMLAEVVAVQKANAALPADCEYHDITARRIKLPLVRRQYALDHTPERRAALLATLEEVCRCPRMNGHKMSGERPGIEYDFAVMKFWDEAGKTLVVPPAAVAGHVDALLKRYAEPACDKELAGAMRVTATRLAEKAGLKDLQTKMAQGLAADLNAPGVIDRLIELGQAPTFTGELVTMDDKKLKFPEDMKGKVVVIDYWATWCGPCKQSMPHFKSVWEKYRDKGVVFIGESCDGKAAGTEMDDTRGKIRKFTEANGYGWTQCGSGQFTVVGSRYGVRAIPHVMVIGKDGKIFKYQARGEEEAAIEAALKQELK